MTVSEAVLRLENIANYLDKYPQDNMGKTGLKNVANVLYTIRDTLIDNEVTDKFVK